MKTGFENLITDAPDDTLNELSYLLDKFMKSSIKIAIKYAHCAQRDTITGIDTIYALKYNARMFSTNHCVYDDNNEDDDDNNEDDDDNNEDEDDNDEMHVDYEHLFTRADDGSEFVNLVNRCHDTWDTWIPETPIEESLKRSVDFVTGTIKLSD